MKTKKSDELALQLRENLKKRKDQKKSLGAKTEQLRNKKIGTSSLLEKQDK
tara:strand:+ start:138 stop:290 length:153 start_codon:yes stop_codon:yes gene_type:complete